ncbi:hypothetical protein vseg_004091 [Gypsophila vaccaria]
MNYTSSNNSPSFSSSLLEQIYRSFDHDNHIDIEAPYPRSRRARRSSTETDRFSAREFDRYVLEEWMEKEKEKEKEKRRNNEKEMQKLMNSAKFRRNSMPEDGKFRHPLHSSSSTSSSDSSSGIGGFSSSDTDSMSTKTSLKPIRTAEFNRKSYSGESPAKSTTAMAAAKAKKSKKEGKLQHALKLYGDLKKVKQPISPGGKLASFLNSLFANSKKPKTEPKTTTASSSVPSTATSYSRSCLSKTPSSAGRFERRSVRFCPVSVVVDETGQKSVYNDDVSRMETCSGGGGGDDELRLLILEKQRRVEEVAKELLKNYRSNNNHQIRKEFKDDEDEDDDDESCCSSDLFELDNILEVGVSDKYRQELPVYETTHVNINRAIANGSIL